MFEWINFRSNKLIKLIRYHFAIFRCWHNRYTLQHVIRKYQNKMYIESFAHTRVLKHFSFDICSSKWRPAFSVKSAYYFPSRNFIFKAYLNFYLPSISSSYAAVFPWGNFTNWYPKKKYWCYLSVWLANFIPKSLRFFFSVFFWCYPLPLDSIAMLHNFLKMLYSSWVTSRQKM